MSIEYKKDLIPNAKELRKNMTRHEKHLWYDFLAKYPVRFQRQKTIQNYIVDFYCHKAMLVIELDGSQHFEDGAEEYDAKRTATLQTHGIEVLRFSNLEIDQNFNGICEMIHMRVSERVDGRKQT